MIGWLIALGAVLLIGFTRVRLRLCYDEAGLAVSVRVGIFHMRLYPRPEKEKKRKEPRVRKAEAQEEPKPKKKALGLKIDPDAIRDLLAIIRKTLRRTARLVRFELIEARFTSGGDDAAKVAVHYGRLNQIIYTVYPILKQNMRIKKTAVKILSDYTLSKSTYYGKLSLSVSIGRSVIFAFASLGSALRFYLRHRNTQEREVSAYGQRKQAQAG